VRKKKKKKEIVDSGIISCELWRNKIKKWIINEREKNCRVKPHESSLIYANANFLFIAAFL
jgi:hypothetical protein